MHGPPGQFDLAVLVYGGR